MMKQFMETVGYLPGTVFTGLTNLILGSTKQDAKGNSVTNPGLVGHLLNGVQYVTRSVADFFTEHKKAIAVAGWLSLAAAATVALTLFLWPAALTAVAAFSIGGFSIAGIVGANAMLQVGFAAGLAAAAASVGTYVTATVANIASYFKGHKKGQQSSNDASFLPKGSNVEDAFSSSSSSSNDIALDSDKKKETPTVETNVEQFNSPIASPKTPRTLSQDKKETDSQQFGMGQN